jgi:hypothetical protein
MNRFVTLLLVAAAYTAQVSHGFAPIRLPATVTTTSSSSRTNTRHSMVAVDTSEIKNGMTIELDGEPFKVLSFSIMKQARGAAKTTIKFKNLMRGTTIENTYRSGEKFETATIEKKTHAFTYNDEVRISTSISLELESEKKDPDSQPPPCCGLEKWDLQNGYEGSFSKKTFFLLMNRRGDWTDEVHFFR